MTKAAWADVQGGMCCQAGSPVRLKLFILQVWQWEAQDGRDARQLVQLLPAGMHAREHMCGTAACKEGGNRMGDASVVG